MNIATEASKAIVKATRYIQYVKKFDPSMHARAEMWANGDANFADHKCDPYAGHEPENNNNQRGD